MDIFEFIKSMIQRIIYDLFKWFITKKIMNPDSGLYYKKVYEKLQIMWFAIKLYVVFFLLKRFVFSSSVRISNRELEIKLALFAVLVVLIVAVIVGRNSQKKLST